MKTIDQAPLENREREAVIAARNVLREQFGAEQIILFGSKARGDADRDSDIDLTIIIGTAVHWKDEKAIVETLFEIGQQYDVIFSPLVISAEEWKSRLFRGFPVFHEIERDGALVS